MLNCLFKGCCVTKGGFMKEEGAGAEKRRVRHALTARRWVSMDCIRNLCAVLALEVGPLFLRRIGHGSLRWGWVAVGATNFLQGPCSRWRARCSK